MLLITAWRNIWRSRTRTLVVIGATIAGIWALVFLLGFFRGQIANYVGSVIQNETSHLQFHHPKFKDDFESRHYMQDAEGLQHDLEQDQRVKAVAPRVILSGMLGSSNAAQGVMVRGISASHEQGVTGLHDKIVEGTPIDTSRKNQMMISLRMAEKLKVKLRSKVVLTFQNTDGDISSAAFRVCGLYKTNKRINDELYVYADIEDLRRLAVISPDASHELAVVLHEFDAVESMVEMLSAQHPQHLVETYAQLSPDLELMNTQIRISMTLMTTIFMLALIFGIINTMLMAVLERTRELGMLMAIGMNKLKVFLLVCIETIIVSIFGAPIGMFLGFLTIRYLNYRGIDLSRWSNALEEFGMSDLVRPFLPWQTYLMIAGAIVITGLLASIYPSLKAIRLRPVEALRKI